MSERFLVVANDQDQYSVWPVGHSIPLGWHATGFVGDRRECLDNIKLVWTDMRPLNIRRSHLAPDGPGSVNPPGTFSPLGA